MAAAQAGLPTGRLWPQLLGQGEQAGLRRREARAGMKRPFMARTKAVCERGAWPRGPVVRESAKQTYLPKGRAAGGTGRGTAPVPRPVSPGPLPLPPSVGARGPGPRAPWSPESAPLPGPSAFSVPTHRPCS